MMHHSASEKQLYHTESTRFFSGGANSDEQLLEPVSESIRKAERIDLIVSFFMESGVKLLLPALKKAAENGTCIRILCGCYMGITEPSALVLLKNELSRNAEIHIDRSRRRSFHPKCYIFHQNDPKKGKKSWAYIGSSNVSRSALAGGIEWNYKVESALDPESMQKIEQTFESIFAESTPLTDAILSEYAHSWKRPPLFSFADTESERPAEVFKADTDRSTGKNKNWKNETDGSENGRQKESAGSDSESEHAVEPRGAQIEALYALKKTRENGNRKAMIHAATGIGKTYLAAFDSLSFRRVLFVAHRREILEQAARSFQRIRPESTIGFLDGKHKDLKADILFASVASLASDLILQKSVLKPDRFDYIIIDEFHHAAAQSYARVLDYFKPAFLLGLTATPQRMDGRSVYALCDFNVPFSLDLHQAINRGLLCPFRYYAIYDETDYSAMRRVNGRLKVEDLEAAYSENKKRNTLIVRHYLKYPSRRAIGFCASRLHAIQMARLFCESGIAAAAVLSGSSGSSFQMERSEALEKLEKGDLQILFCVDLFNEGLDLPAVDMVLFLRPTESSVIFLQQLGRGLRLSLEKDHLNVLDFIGNYEKAALVPAFLGSVKPEQLSAACLRTLPLPDGCLADFDLQLIDLFDHNRLLKKDPVSRLQQNFHRIRQMLGHRPTQKELFENLDDDLLETLLKSAKLNPFRNYLGFLASMNALSPEEEEICQSSAGNFLIRIQQTAMSRVYKMPVLLSFLDEEGSFLQKEVDEQTLLNSWKAFFDQQESWRDLTGKNGPFTWSEFRQMSDADHLRRIHSQPLHFLLKSEGAFFHKGKDGGLRLDDSLDPWLCNPLFAKLFSDCLAYRIEYYYYRRSFPDAAGSS